MNNNPRVIDNDQGEITVSLDGKELRGWNYENDDEPPPEDAVSPVNTSRGWCDGRDAMSRGKAKADADMIVRALNLMNGRLP